MYGKTISGFLIFAWLIGAVAGMISAEGRSLYVSVNGNDDNLGTEVKPWRSLAKACTAIAGDTVYIREGMYAERLIPVNSGREDAPITFMSYPGEVAIIDGASLEMSHWGGLVHLEQRENIRVTGLRIMNSKGAGIFVVNSRGMRIDGNHISDTTMPGIMAWYCVDVDIVENEVERGCMGDNIKIRTQECISLADTDHFTIAGNHVHHGKKEGIDAKDGSRHGLVFGNLVHHQVAVGIYIDSWDKHEYDIKVFNNICHDNGTQGIAVASENGGLLEQIQVNDNIAYRNGMAGFVVAGWGKPTGHPLKDIQIYRNLAWDNERGIVLIGNERALLENIKVHNNVAYRNHAQGIGLWGEYEKKHEVTMRGVEIVNNTIVGNGISEAWGSGGIQIFNLKVRGLIIRNNIVSDNKHFTIAFHGPMSPGEVVIDHNLVDGFRGAYRETKGDAVVTGFPRFIDAAQVNFHLASGSPAIDSGSPDGAPVSDFDMVVRPQGSGIDIGAFEFIQ